eukprot:TRINITY_DN15183_c0_g1_i2.p1 TRINITY_DN15183_c0_g1~~TRINITY_DN15183_c0_g1_i2.p1  ORF type:complete len:309 (+),score=42.71 TRINITY_DN15183_c0_g1_i2:144-1070(+)
MEDPLVRQPTCPEAGQPHVGRDASQRLMRAASTLGGTAATTAVGGGTSTQPQSRPALHRAQSVRLRNRQAVAETQNNILQARFWLLLLVPFLVVCIYSCVATVQVLITSLNDPSDTCPLQEFNICAVTLLFAWSQVSKPITEFIMPKVAPYGVCATMLVQAATLIPTVLVIYRGANLLQSVTPEDKCDEDIKFYTSRYVTALAVVLVVSFVLTTILLSVLRYLVNQGVTLAGLLAAPREIKELPKVPFDPEVMKDGLDGHTSECPICMEKFDYQKPIVETSCKHQFHEECINKWQRTSGACPLCRQVM